MKKISLLLLASLCVVLSMEAQTKTKESKTTFAKEALQPYVDSGQLAGAISVFYKMLMNLSLGENGVRILKEETVKSILARSTRPANMSGYSLGLTAPVEDTEDAWFGHGGAWGTNCSVNWHKKELKLWVVQHAGGAQPWNPAVSQAAEKFFAQPLDNSNIDAYTGRTK